MGMTEAAVGPDAVPSRAENVEVLVSAVCSRCQLYVGKNAAEFKLKKHTLSGNCMDYLHSCMRVN